MSWVLQGYGRIRGMVAGEGGRSRGVLLYHESVIFFVFLAFILLCYGHFVEYMNMHAWNMWLTVTDGTTVVVRADWTLHPWRHNNVGGITAGQARHNSSNVGCVGLLRARWDTTLVYI